MSGSDGLHASCSTVILGYHLPCRQVAFVGAGRDPSLGFQGVSGPCFHKQSSTVGLLAFTRSYRASAVHVADNVVLLRDKVLIVLPRACIATVLISFWWEIDRGIRELMVLRHFIRHTSLAACSSHKQDSRDVS